MTQGKLPTDGASDDGGGVSERRAERIFQDFQARIRKGEKISLAELCSGYPEMAGAFQILKSLEGTGSLEADGDAGTSSVVGASLLRSRELGPAPRGETGKFCVRCGTEIGDKRFCRQPDCDGLPNFYRDVVRRAPRRRGEVVDHPGHLERKGELLE